MRNQSAFQCDIETGLFITYERAWSRDWMREWKAGRYIPWPDYVAMRLNIAMQQEIEDRAGAGLPVMADFSFPAFDGDHGCWIIDEQLYPESRGTLAHRFTTYAEARKFYKSKI